MLTTRWTTAAMAAATLVCSLPAAGAIDPGVLSFEVGPSDGAKMSISLAMLEEKGTLIADPDKDNVFSWSLDDGESFVGPGGAWSIDAWTIESFDADPVLNQSFSLNNTSGATMNFVFTATGVSTIAIDGITADGLIDADVINGTLAALPGDAIYNAFVGVEEFAPLLAGASLTGSPFASDFEAFGPAGFPIDLSVGEAFGFEVEFSLTPGASASFNGLINIVPEPASLILVAIGAVACLGEGRRRSRARA